MERLGQQRLSHYRFRHNLFQQYVYSNLAETERNYLHEDIALALEEMYGEQAKNIAPQLAWHFEQADNIEKTLEYLLLAGQKAQILGSNKEALIHYKRGLSTITQLPSNSELIAVELGFQAGLGVALLPVEGFQSKQVSIAFGRALELCRQIGGTNSLLMSIYSGLTNYACCNSDLSLQTSLEWANEFKAVAEKQEDLAHLTTAESLLMTIHFNIGHIDKAIELGNSVLHSTNYQTSKKNMIIHYGHDQRVGVAPLLSWMLCFKGKIKEAKTLLIKESPSNFQHAASKGLFLGTFCMCCQAFQATDYFTSLKFKSISEELLKLADEYGYYFWQACGLICHGWVLAQLGEVDEGITEMQQGLNMARMSGGLPMGSYLLIMLAEGLFLKHKYHKALENFRRSI